MKSEPYYAKGNTEEGLTPITSQWMTELMESPVILKELMCRYGSPVNIHHLPPFKENIEGYRDMFNSYGLKHKILYARKANKCMGFVSAAEQVGIGVDTASQRELFQALEMGISPENLVLTAAIKTAAQIRLAIQNGVAIILDNQDECQLVQEIAELLDKKALVGFRVSGFEHQGTKLYSRFGFDISKIGEFISVNIGQGKKWDLIECLGLHFHLDGYSTSQRSSALLQCIHEAVTLKKEGYGISFIDMGGGILMNYLKDKREWESFAERLQLAVRGLGKNVTFNNDGLGFRLEGGDLTGQLETYPFYNEVNGPNFVREILDSKDSNGTCLCQLLKSNDLEIRIEPGRSLLAQSGITVAKVAHRKQDSKGNWLVGLEMNMSQMMSGSKDFLVDPFVLYDNAREEGPVDVFFTGAYCLERDILLKRKTVLPQLPQVGEVVVFVNTAGYMMHFFETEAHLFELSSNILYEREANMPISPECFKNDAEFHKV
ncbi:MAG: Y4yA family PLP-dependent enzyme [Sediminicola sp.]